VRRRWIGAALAAAAAPALRAQAAPFPSAVEQARYAVILRRVRISPS
jgi:hypothetical protein